MPTLFYSVSCSRCKIVLKLLKASKLLNSVKLFCINNQKVPKKIKIVPTILTDNQVLVGYSSVLKWVRLLVKDRSECRPYQPEVSAFSSIYTYLGDIPQLEDYNSRYKYLDNVSEGFSVVDKEANTRFNLEIQERQKRQRK